MVEDEAATVKTLTGYWGIMAELVKLHGVEWWIHQKTVHQIEDGFHHIKHRDLVAYHPVYHWTDSKIRVRTFVCVIALLLLRVLQYIARENDMEISTRLLIEELEDVTTAVLIYSPRKVERKIHTMSKVEKRLFDVFELHRYT